MSTVIATLADTAPAVAAARAKAKAAEAARRAAPTPAVVEACLGSLADFRRAARRAVGTWGSCPVEIVPGDAAPTLDGEPFRHETPGGEIVRYPHAYSEAFGRLIYFPSTLRVVVGRGWTPAPGTW